MIDAIDCEFARKLNKKGCDRVMKVVSEIHQHLECEHCTKWWNTVSVDYRLGDKTTCPFCGKENIVLAISPLGSVAINGKEQRTWV